MYVCMCVRVCVCVYVYVYIYMLFGRSVDNMIIYSELNLHIYKTFVSL